MRDTPTLYAFNYSMLRLRHDSDWQDIYQSSQQQTARGQPFTVLKVKRCQSDERAGLPTMKGMIKDFKRYDVLSDPLGAYHKMILSQDSAHRRYPKSAWPRVSARTILAVLVIHNPLADLFTSLHLCWHAIRIGRP